jgi:OOP family OmpA-OmpF porin
MKKLNSVAALFAAVALVMAGCASTPEPTPAPQAAPAAPATPAPAAAPAPAPAPAAPATPPPPAAVKVTYAADTFFDFDKSVIKPEAKAKLDDLAEKVKGINLEVIIAVGHADSIGTDEYNQKLSVRRAEAVKAYLTSKGIDKNRVYTEGKGEKQPVADNRTSEGRAKNRRVEIEVVGTRPNK